MSNDNISLIIFQTSDDGEDANLSLADDDLATSNDTSYPYEEYSEYGSGHEADDDLTTSVIFILHKDDTSHLYEQYSEYGSGYEAGDDLSTSNDTSYLYEEYSQFDPVSCKIAMFLF